VTLVDTSVWIDFFRGSAKAKQVAFLLEVAEVLVHPFVNGELALGHLGQGRALVLEDLGRLPSAPRIEDVEVFEMVEARRLAGSGIGWVDAHLLASALTVGADLWTFDRALLRIATRFGLAHVPRA
jgi:predicted nucleic acid-binding protein